VNMRGVTGRRIAAVAALCLAAVWLSPAAVRLLELTLPAQRLVLQAWWPQAQLLQLSLVTTGRRLVFDVALRLPHHVVAGARLLPPGLVLTAQTPARPAALHAALLACAAAWAWWRGTSSLRRGAAIVAGWSALLLCIAPASAIAGQLASVITEPWSEPSRHALAAALSIALLHGGGIALCMAATWQLHRRGAGAVDSVGQQARAQHKGGTRPVSAA